jgi:DNA-binding MarR family transcriptional regulator
VGTVEAGAPLARLLAMALTALVTELHERLEQRGWERTRPLWGFVLLFIRQSPRRISEIGVLLGVTKQAAAKAVASLEEAGLVERREDPSDGRAVSVCLSAVGEDFLADVEHIYADLEREWADAIGARRLSAARHALADALAAHYAGAPPPLRPTL